MAQLHGGLGVAIAIIYLGIALASWILTRRQGLPAWLTGTAHGPLVVQVVLGIVLFSRHPHAVPWRHPVFGGLAGLALGLLAPPRSTSPRWSWVR